MRNTRARLTVGLAFGAVAGLLAGCDGGAYPHLNQVVIHQSGPQIAEIRNPFPEELTLLEPENTDPGLWEQIGAHRDDRVDTAIRIPPGGAHRLPFHVVTVTDDPAPAGLTAAGLVLPVHYLREDRLERDPRYLIQDGPTVRVRVQRGEAPPAIVLLSLYGCPDRSWGDGPAAATVHRIIAAQSAPLVPQTLCPRG